MPVPGLVLVDSHESSKREGFVIDDGVEAQRREKARGWDEAGRVTQAGRQSALPDKGETTVMGWGRPESPNSGRLVLWHSCPRSKGDGRCHWRPVCPVNVSADRGAYVVA